MLEKVGEIRNISRTDQINQPIKDTEEDSEETE